MGNLIFCFLWNFALKICCAVAAAAATLTSILMIYEDAPNLVLFYLLQLRMGDIYYNMQNTYVRTNKQARMYTRINYYKGVESKLALAHTIPV